MKQQLTDRLVKWFGPRRGQQIANWIFGFSTPRPWIPNKNVPMTWEHVTALRSWGIYFPFWLILFALALFAGHLLGDSLYSLFPIFPFNWLRDYAWMSYGALVVAGLTWLVWGRVLVRGKQKHWVIRHNVIAKPSHLLLYGPGWHPTNPLEANSFAETFIRLFAIVVEVDEPLDISGSDDDMSVQLTFMFEPEGPQFMELGDSDDARIKSATSLARGVAFSFLQQVVGRKSADTTIHAPVRATRNVNRLVRSIDHVLRDKGLKLTIIIKNTDYSKEAKSARNDEMEAKFMAKAISALAINGVDGETASRIYLASKQKAKWDKSDVIKTNIFKAEGDPEALKALGKMGVGFGAAGDEHTDAIHDAGH